VVETRIWLSSAMTPAMKHVRTLLAFGSFAAAVLACSSTNTTVAPDGGTSSSGGGGSCDAPVTVEKDAYCDTCSPSAGAVPAACKAPRTVNACCTWVQPPSQALVRGTGLNRYSTNDPTIDLACLDAPAAQGTSQTITLKGHVRLFSSGEDSKGAKIEIFKQNEDGSLGDLVGSSVTSSDDNATIKTETFLKKCPDGGCRFRAYEYPGVPTETRLVVKTSDAGGNGQWAELYDYDIYFPSADVKDGVVEYEPSVVAATDINTVASAAGGFTVKQDKGLLAGEVHDCADVRLAGATVDIDAAHEADMFYFGENESDPLPDKSRSSLGTSKLGLFGTLNVTTGVPIRISAVGKQGDQTILLGTTIVRTFPGAVTALRLRGRRPWQK
jgi:hypothetical protein